MLKKLLHGECLVKEMSSKGKELFNNAVHKVRERKRVEEDENKSRLAFMICWRSV